MAVAASVAALTGCGSSSDVTYDTSSPGADALTVYAGTGSYRSILKFVSDKGLAAGVHLTVVDAPADADAKIAAGQGDLAFFQHVPAFDADVAAGSIKDLSVVSAVDVVPYGLYSSRWHDLKDTSGWVNSGLGADNASGRSLPHGSRIAVPDTVTGAARALYLLQSAALVRLDRRFGGTTVPDLTITQSNVLDSPRHLSLAPVSYAQYVGDIYRNYDAVVLAPDDAAKAGLRPDRDALALEPGQGNPYAHVLVAPARLAGDHRVLELARALESPQVAAFLENTYHGADIPAARSTTNRAPVSTGP
ncbi:MetQ/NlpA family ABC transporter substrate-binding protein [Gordonia sp. DT30]